MEKMENQLNILRTMADEEQEHPQLADEIRAQIRGFESGLCFLGPENTFDDLCRLPEHFVGRKIDIKNRR